MRPGATGSCRMLSRGGRRRVGLEPGGWPSRRASHESGYRDSGRPPGQADRPSFGVRADHPPAAGTDEAKVLPLGNGAIESNPSSSSCPTFFSPRPSLIQFSLGRPPCFDGGNARGRRWRPCRAMTAASAAPGVAGSTGLASAVAQSAAAASGPASGPGNLHKATPWPEAPAGTVWNQLYNVFEVGAAVGGVIQEVRWGREQMGQEGLEAETEVKGGHGQGYE